MEDEGKVRRYGKKGVALDYTNEELAKMKTGKKKTCGKCKQHLDLSEFSLMRSSPDGRQPHCKKCAAKYNAGRKEGKQGNHSGKQWRRSRARTLGSILKEHDRRIGRLERFLGI